VTTRLSNAAKNSALTDLRSLLNNVVGFVGCPITDRSQLVALWNSKYPEDLVNSVRVLGTYNIGMGSGGLTTDSIRWCTEIDGKLHCAMVKLDEIGVLSQEKMKQGIVQYAMGLSMGALAAKGIYREVKLDGDDSNTFHTKASCLEIDAQDMSNVLGADLTDEVISWMKQTAAMRSELIIANKALEEIFGMAATAGQIKRMVPDLLQYLPTAQRIAFEEQKRASTVPFEWAPFPKSNVDVMLTQINKGHLLQNMRKPGRQQYSVKTIDHCTWARSDCQWAK
jgi:hypothetical protein